MKYSPRILAVALALVLAIPHTLTASGSTTITQAAEANDTAAVLKCVDEGQDPNLRQVDGMTPLLWASYHDNLNTAIALIDAGAEPQSSNRYGVTPLRLACQNGNENLVLRLLREGADPNEVSLNGEPILMTAARTGLTGPVIALLAAGAEPRAQLPNGQTALMWAVAEGHLAVTELLLNSGADPYATLPSGFNPFFFAIREGHAEIVELFIERGVDIHATMQVENPRGKLPRRGTAPMILAMENGHFELAKRFLDLGADPNDSRTGQSPLHLLVRVRKPDRGEGAAGEPPPRILGDMDSLDFASALIEKGAEINIRIEEGSPSRNGRLGTKDATPFLLACDTADLSYMKFLLDHGADPFLPNSDGTTPLMAAAGIGSMAPEEEAGTPAECLAAVKLLVSLGADVNKVDSNGETAMHGAAYKNAPELVLYLNEQGADIQVWNTKNSLGWYPLYIAEGYRPGNFKPSFETIDAINLAMKEHGVQGIDEERPTHVNYSP